jgi:shikimate kinase
MKSNIFLVGPMGAGKSTVGNLLAQTLQFNFYDADKEIEKSANMEVDQIFEVEGEEKFRGREEKIIAELTQHQRVVIATGGGAILSLRNRQILSERGFTFYLRVSLEKQLERIQSVKGRPLLKNTDMSQKLSMMQKIREPLYQAAANKIINTDDLNAKEIVESILDFAI